MNLGHYLKLAIRKALNARSSYIIKTGSITIGLVSLFYIGLYVYQEFSFDNFHSKKSNLYRLNTTIYTPTGNLALALTAFPVGPYVQSNLFDITAHTAVSMLHGSHSVQHRDKLFSESGGIYYADHQFFKLFDFKLLHGDISTIFQRHGEIVLSEDIAMKYFGRLNVIGEVLDFDGEPFTISGITENTPYNSQIQFDFLISMPTFTQPRENIGNNWTWFPMTTYILVNPQADLDEIGQYLKDLPQYSSDSNSSEKFVLSLEPVQNIHFSESRLGELGTKSRISDLYILLTIAALILLLSLTNYISLSFAESTVNDKQVMLKRTLGAGSKQLFLQFYMEAFLVAAIAICLSAVLVIVSLPIMESILGHQIRLSLIYGPRAWLSCFLILLLLPLIVSIYPMQRLSRISDNQKMMALKNSDATILKMRSGLVVIQFSITSILIIGSFIMYRQLKFLQNRDLGINTSQTLVIDYGSNADVADSYESLKSQLLAIEGVQQVAFSSHVPGQMPNGVTTKIETNQGVKRSGEINLNLVDHDYLENYQIKLIAGRGFEKDKNDTGDEPSVIFNESTVKAYGFENPEEILGAKVEQWGGAGRVIGVVEDFNYLSLHNEVGLLSLKIWPSQFEKISIKLDFATTGEVVNRIGEKWSDLFPNLPFNYYFVDEVLKQQYDKDRRYTYIISLFTLNSIFLGIIGLIAFAIFWCHRKRKDVSIKKVLGANPFHLIWSFYKDFSKPIILSFILSTPVALYLGDKWLLQFVDGIQLEPSIVLIPLIFILLVTGLSVGVQSVKTVFAHPVKYLNNE